MNLKAKLYEEHHKQIAQQNLAARIALLETQGAGQPTIEKDVLVRKLKADIRKANRRLTQVTAQEKLIAQKLQHKEEKAAAKKKQASEPVEAPAAKKAAAKTEKKEKKSKEKKQAPAKQE
jgi:hypothetical protein